MGNLRWKTMKRLNVQRTDHTWKVRLIGKPEFKYVEELIRALDAGGFTYRIINHSLSQHDCRNWVFSNNCINHDWWLVQKPYITAMGMEYFYNSYSGEIYATRNETISIMVYKNTTQLRLITRG